MSITRLIIGLGNPGDEYVRTRHNIGFMAVDALAAHTHCGAWKKKFRSLITSRDQDLLAKPQTYMNLSGEAVAEMVGFYRLKPEQVIVFHDDLDLVAGQIKVKQGGGAGGHNGLKSLDTHIGPNYWRIRMGIGRPLTEQGEMIKGDAVTNYVLNPFSKADKIWLDPLLDGITSHIEYLWQGNLTVYATALTKI